MTLYEIRLTTRRILMETTIAKGKIQCVKHGPLTAFDCDSFQDNTCDGCFIYTALKDQSIDLEEFSFKDVELQNSETIQ